MNDFVTYALPSWTKSVAIDFARLALAAALFFTASLFAIPSMPSQVPVEVTVPSATIVTTLMMAGVIAIPSRGWARWVGLVGFSAAIWLTIWVVSDGVAHGGVWGEGVTWVKGRLP